jgi:fatty acid desaturase
MEVYSFKLFLSQNWIFVFPMTWLLLILGFWFFCFVLFIYEMESYSIAQSDHKLMSLVTVPRSLLILTPVFEQDFYKSCT